MSAQPESESKVGKGHWIAALRKGKDTNVLSSPLWVNQGGYLVPTGAFPVGLAPSSEVKPPDTAGQQREQLGTMAYTG